MLYEIDRNPNGQLAHCWNSEGGPEENDIEGDDGEAAAACFDVEVPGETSDDESYGDDDDDDDDGSAAADGQDISAGQWAVINARAGESNIDVMIAKQVYEAADFDRAIANSRAQRF
jgi:hypothetical protein